VCKPYLGTWCRPPNARFSSTVAPKKRFLSHWIQNVISKPIKNDVSNYGINLKKIIQQSPITILPIFLAGEFSHKIEAFLLVLKGFLWVCIMGSQNVMGLGYESNISVTLNNVTGHTNLVIWKKDLVNSWEKSHNVLILYGTRSCRLKQC
jgi:hypothetical protein